MSVTQSELESAHRQLHAAGRTIARSARDGQERGRYLAMRNVIVDLDAVRARLLEYEEKPFLAVVDEITLARKATAYILAGCIERAFDEFRFGGWLALRFRALRVLWTAIAAVAQAAFRGHGYRIDLANHLRAAQECC